MGKRAPRTYKWLFRQFRYALLAVLVLAGLGATRAPQEAVNLLQNPGFEGEYSAWFYIPEAQVAPGWTPWWRTRTDADPEAYYFKPEYKKANGYIFPNRVHGGAAAQQWFTFFSTHDAGMYQQVFGVTPGVRYRFTIWAHVWSSSKNDPNVSEDPAQPNLQVGIDPTGNWNPWSQRVIWSGTYAYYDTWGQLAVEAVAEGDVLTVFMRSQPDLPVKHNDTYWDDAELVAVGQGGTPPRPTLPPTAAPSDTPVPPAASSEPQATSTGAPATLPEPLATSIGSPTPTATCAPPPKDWVTYTVQPGDTLAGLVKAVGASQEAVIAANCLRNPNVIHIGQALRLPSLPATSTPARPTITATALVTTPATPTPTRQPTATPSPVPTATPLPIPTATPSPTPAPPTVAQATSTQERAQATPVPQGGGLCSAAGLGAAGVLWVGLGRLAGRSRRLRR